VPKISNLLQSYLIADAVVSGITDVPIPTFLGLSDNYGGDGTNHSWDLTLKELLGMGTGPQGDGIHRAAGWTQGGMPAVLKRNLKENGAEMAMKVVGYPIIFSVAKKLLSKPVINPANRLLKQIGVTGVKL
jgi:hypothetical protein